MKQSKTFASGFPVEETIESLRQQLAEKDAEIERLEEERDDALQGPWAEWAEKSLKIIREHTGYDGYDDRFDGVNLPNELAEAFNEFEAEEERLRQQLAEARQEIADRKADCETGHDQDEATIAELRRELKHMTDEYHAALDAEQVRYRQVVEKDAEIARLYRDQEQYGPDKVAIEKQAWVEADRQRQINELRKRLAEKEAEIERLKEEQAELIRRFQNENCGQTFMGEPVIQDRPVPAKQYMAAVNGRRAFRSQVIELRQQLAAAQASEQQANECRIALVHQIHELADHIERAEYCINDIDMLKQMRGQRAYAMKVAGQWNQNGNPFSDDTTALEAMIAKAGEVMRERAVKSCKTCDGAGGHEAAMTSSTMYFWKKCDDCKDICAIPGVTLEDLK